MKQVIGIDFDNTIVKYDELFHKVALERKLIPENIPVIKEAVRDYLRSIGKEDDWTEMQGYVYGARMEESLAFPGVLSFIQNGLKKGFEINIVSHKTKHPYLGMKYDLHGAALGWLEKNGVFDSSKIGLKRENVFFEPTKKDKLARIASIYCNVFIDDLPEILSDSDFPKDCKKILFGQTRSIEDSNMTRLTAWTDLNMLSQILGYE